MTGLPAYSGPRAICPKCKVGHLTTTWHYSMAVTEKTPRGDEWPCTWSSWRDDKGRLRLEHLCRCCRNCGYTRAEALAADPGDPGEATTGAPAIEDCGWRSALTGLEIAEAARPHLDAPLPASSREALGMALLELVYQAVRNGDNVAAVRRVDPVGPDGPAELTYLRVTGPDVERWTARTGHLTSRWAATVHDGRSALLDAIRARADADQPGPVTGPDTGAEK